MAGNYSTWRLTRQRSEASTQVNNPDDTWGSLPLAAVTTTFPVDRRWRTNQEEDEQQSEISTIHIHPHLPTPQQLTLPRRCSMPAPFMLPILR